MTLENSISIKGEYQDVRAEVRLENLRLNRADQLLDSSITVGSRDWSFSSSFCFALNALNEFQTALKGLIEQTEVNALLPSYTEESWLRVSITNKARGEIMIEGCIARPDPILENKLHGSYPAPNKQRTGAFFSFSGIVSDQSFLNETIKAIIEVNREARINVCK